MQAKAFNPQIFLEFLCYSVFAVLMFYLVNSGKYLSYVTPRMEPYLYFTAIVMLVWACAGLSRLFRPQHKIRSAHCFVLAIPILFLLLPHSPLSSADLSAKYMSGKAFSGIPGASSSSPSNKQEPSGKSDFNAATNTPEEDPAENSADGTDKPFSNTEDDASSLDPVPPEDSISDSGDTTVPDTQTDVPGDAYTTDLPGLDVKNKKITVSNDDFGLWISEIFANMEKYKGYQITMTGFVFKDPELFKENEFVPARLMMSCCAADLAPAGLLCKYDKTSELKADSWVTVQGTLHIGKYKFDDIEYDDPQISVTKITPAEEVEGYVYPY